MTAHQRVILHPNGVPGIMIRSSVEIPDNTLEPVLRLSCKHVDTDFVRLSILVGNADVDIAEGLVPNLSVCKGLEWTTMRSAVISPSGTLP